jgi:hypothetical protein
MNRYRIKHVAGLGHFAQVKVSFSCFSDIWKTIAWHGGNLYGLYDDDGHPIVTSNEAENLIRDYDESINATKNPTYKDFTL